jgi:hypothetical protein
MASISEFLTATSLMDIVPLSDWSTPTLTPPAVVSLVVSEPLSLLQAARVRTTNAMQANKVFDDGFFLMRSPSPWMSSPRDHMDGRLPDGEAEMLRP